jgi:hypothetical protein
MEKQMILNLVKNIVEPNRARIKHSFHRWKTSVDKRKKIKSKLLLSPITANSRKDYEEQMNRIKTGEQHMWDDSSKNNSVIGDYFGYVENQSKIGRTEFKTQGSICIYKIVGVCDPVMRLDSWSENVGQSNRNVILLSKEPYYQGTLSEFKQIAGYSENWNSQGTSNVSFDKSKRYLTHIFS